MQKVFRSPEGIEDFLVVLLEKPWYSKAVECLDAFFKPRGQEFLERHKFRNMKQGMHERFSQFLLRLRQQLAECSLEKYPAKVRTAIEEIMLTGVIVKDVHHKNYDVAYWRKIRLSLILKPWEYHQRAYDSKKRKSVPKHHAWN